MQEFRVSARVTTRRSNLPLHLTGTGPRSRAPLARGAIVDARVPQVSGDGLGR
jgi:hypothetical protein